MLNLGEHGWDMPSPMDTKVEEEGGGMAEPTITASREDVESVGKVTQAVMADVLKRLTEGAAIRADGAPRLFFPSGIELIDVSVSVGLPKGAEVKVKIAGAAAPKSSEVESRSDGLAAGPVNASG